MCGLRTYVRRATRRREHIPVFSGKIHRRSGTGETARDRTSRSPGSKSAEVGGEGGNRVEVFPQSRLPLMAISTPTVRCAQARRCCASLTLIAFLHRRSRIPMDKFLFDRQRLGRTPRSSHPQGLASSQTRPTSPPGQARIARGTGDQQRYRGDSVGNKTGAIERWRMSVGRCPSFQVRTEGRSRIYSAW